MICSHQLADDVASWLVVETGTDGRLSPATEGSTTVVGVVLAGHEENGDLSAVPQGGRPIWRCPGWASVVSGGTEAHVVYAQPAPDGAKLVAAAGGRVAPAAPGTDPQAIVGTCTEPGGVVNANDFGLMRTV